MPAWSNHQQFTTSASSHPFANPAPHPGQYRSPHHSPYPSPSMYPPSAHLSMSKSASRNGLTKPCVGGTPDVSSKKGYSSLTSPNSSLPPSPALSSSSSTSNEQELQVPLQLGGTYGYAGGGMAPNMPPHPQMTHNMGYTQYGNPCGNPYATSPNPYAAVGKPQVQASPGHPQANLTTSSSSNRSTPYSTPHQTPSHTPHHSPPPSANSSLSGQTRANADQLKTFLRKKVRPSEGWLGGLLERRTS